MGKDLELPAIGAGSGPPDEGDPAHQEWWFEEAEDLEPDLTKTDPVVVS